MGDVMSIGEKIVEIMDWYGMEQKELSRRAGLPYTTVHGYLKQGKSIPSDSLVKIANALRVSPLTLMNLDPLPVSQIELTDMESEMLALYRTLSTDQRDFIEQSIALLSNKNKSLFIK